MFFFLVWSKTARILKKIMVHVVKTVKEAVEQNMMRYFLWWKYNSDASLSLSDFDEKEMQWHRLIRFKFYATSVF